MEDLQPGRQELVELVLGQQLAPVAGGCLRLVAAVDVGVACLAKSTSPISANAWAVSCSHAATFRSRTWVRMIASTSRSITTSRRAFHASRNRVCRSRACLFPPVTLSESTADDDPYFQQFCRVSSAP